MGAELEEAMGVGINVGTPDALRDRLRDDVLAGLEYAAAAVNQREVPVARPA